MPAALSVIIPTLNSAATLGPTLACVHEAVEIGLLKELILADGGSSDGIEALADDVGAQLVRTAPGRGSQMAAGGAAARGGWLLFLHADTVLSAGWAGVAGAHMRTSDKTAYFRLAFDVDGFAPRRVAGWANLRSKAFGLPYGDQGLLIPAALYHRIGGYPAIPLMEDVAIVRALRGRLVALPATATTGARRYQQEGWFRRGGRNLVTLLLYFLGRSPEKLAARYGKSR